jgi:hypothetical protein
MSIELPQGRQEFDAFANNIISKAGLPDNDSTRFAVATSILHTPEPKSEVTEEYFVQILKRGAARQVAVAVMQELKEKQKKQAEEEALKAQQLTAEAAANNGGNDVGSTETQTSNP